jgi:hypothetical protein
MDSFPSSAFHSRVSFKTGLKLPYRIPTPAFLPATLPNFRTGFLHKLVLVRRAL